MNKSDQKHLIKLAIFAGIAIILAVVCYVTKLFPWNGFDGVKVDLITVLKLIIMVCGVLAVELLAVFILNLFKPKSHRARSVVSVVSSVLKYVAAIVILCWGLSIIGVNISTIVASVGIVALVVGFSAESLIADMVTGAFMIFENQYNVGDIVEVDGFRGTVSNIGLRTTCLTDPGGNVKIVNNSAMKNILNRSDKPSRAISVIGVPYGTDFKKLESQIPALMQRIKDAHPDLFKQVPSYLGIDDLAESAVVMKFVGEVDEDNIFIGRRVLNHDLLLGFKDLGVECPFPQVDVHNIPAK